MNGSNDSQKLDLIITEQKKLRTLVDKVEVSVLNEVRKNRNSIEQNTKSIEQLSKEVRTSNKILDKHEERIASLESQHPSATLA